VYIGSLDSMEGTRLLDAEAAAVFLPPDQILFPRQGALLAQRMNVKTLQLEGQPRTVATHVAVDIVNALAAVSASATGLVAYRVGAEERQVVWFSRSGQRMGSVTGPDATLGQNMRLSPDGLTVAMTRTVGGNTDVWLVETLRSVFRRFTVEATVETGPLWSPDGRQVAFISDRKGTMNIYEKPVNGDGDAALLIESSEDKAASDWSADGRFILYRDRGANRATTFGSNRSSGIRNRRRSHKLHLMNKLVGFHLTAAGLPTNPTKADKMKSMCSRFSAPVAKLRSQRAAGYYQSGTATDVNSSTSPRIIG
jgi:hypothetical protein